MHQTLQRRAGFTLIEIMIVVAIIALIIAIALPNFRKTRERARTQICIENLAQIRSAKQIIGVQDGRTTGDEVAEADLYGIDGYIRKTPECPAGGEYTINPIGTPPTCTIPTHVLFESDE